MSEAGHSLEWQRGYEAALIAAEEWAQRESEGIGANDPEYGPIRAKVIRQVERHPMPAEKVLTAREEAVLVGRYDRARCECQRLSKLAKSHADSLATTREENEMLKAQVGNLLGLLLRAGVALVAERAGGPIDWTIGPDIDAVLPQGSAWHEFMIGCPAGLEATDADR